jgi:transaldolase
MQDPVDHQIVETLYNRIADFRRAYDDDGMTPAEFDGYGATVRTLRGFAAAVHELTAIVREYMLPNPDVK